MPKRTRTVRCGVCGVATDKDTAARAQTRRGEDSGFTPCDPQGQLCRTCERWVCLPCAQARRREHNWNYVQCQTCEEGDDLVDVLGILEHEVAQRHWTRRQWESFKARLPEIEAALAPDD